MRGQRSRAITSGLRLRSGVTEISFPVMLEELQRRNYSSETIRGYIFAAREFAEHYGESPEGMGAEELRQYQVRLLQKRKLAPGTVESRISALRFL